MRPHTPRHLNFVEEVLSYITNGDSNVIKIVLYGILLAVFGYALFALRKMYSNQFRSSGTGSKARQRYRLRNTRELWVQVYETSSSDDAHLIQARLQEEEVECLIYEQGKKDIYGNTLKGIGIAVPKSSVPLAQKVISRMPV